jgi:class 3 adenylate cyclase
MKNINFKLAILISFFIISNSSPLFAQKQGQAKIDSLLKELPKAKEDTNKVKLLDDLSYEYYTINPDDGIKYGEQCLHLSEMLKWKKGIEIALTDLGNCYLVQTNYSKAIDFYSKSLNISKAIGNKNGISNNLVSIGNVYIQQSNYPLALEYLFKALKICEETGNKNNIISNLGSIASVYLNEFNYPKALEYYFKGLKFSEEIGNKKYEATMMGNIGITYNYMSDYQKALEFFMKSLKLHKELGNKRGIAIVLGNIGNVYNCQKKYEKSIEYYFDALKFHDELGDKSGIAINLGNIGESYYKLVIDTNKLIENNQLFFLNKKIMLEKSIQYSLKAVEISKEIGEINILILLYDNLALANKEYGNYKNAYEYSEESHKLKDSLFSIENNIKIKNLENNREIELKNKLLEIQNLNLKNQRTTQFFLLIGLATLISIVIFVVYLRRKSEKLLLNILPAKIAKRLKKKEHPIADSFDSASIVFIDIVDFTKNSSRTEPKRIVEVLNVLYTKLDKIAQKYGLEKIKTIGDCYMAAAGIPISDPDNAIKAAQFSLEAMKLLKDYDTGDGTILNFRCGVDCGPVVAGVIGVHKFIYDVWGDTVNTAARMESNGVAGKIQVSERFKEKISNNEQGISNIEFEERGMIEIKGKGMMKTYFLNPANL